MIGSGGNVSEMKKGVVSFSVRNLFKVFDECEKCGHMRQV